MFKKTLICVALAAVSGGAMAKATGTLTTLVQSTEGMQDIIAIPVAAVSYALGASYVQGDTVTLTYSQPFSTGLVHAALSITDTASVAIPLTVLSSDTTSVVYRAGAVPATFDYSVANTLAVPTKTILGSNQADGTIVTLDYKAATAQGIAIDAGTVVASVAEIHDQYMLVATKTAKQVDVENGRKQYVGATAALKTQDTVGVSISADTVYTARVALATHAAGTMVATLNGAGLTASIAKVNGNYSWLDKTSTAAYDIDPLIGTIAPAFAATTHKADSVTIAPAVLGTAVSVDTTTLKTNVLPTGAYSVDVTAKYANQATTQKSKVFDNLSLGAWTLNGSTITAYGMPNSASVTPFLWIQNAGTGSGEISGSVSCDGVTTDLGSLGNAVGDTNTSIGAAVQAKVDAAGTCAATSRYDATITVNAKATDISVTSGYRVTAADGSNDRLGLETSDSLD